MPWEGPQKLASQVYEFVRENSLHITTRPVDSFALFTLKEHPEKLKFGLMGSNIVGNTYSLYLLSVCPIVGQDGIVQPYINVSFCLEWPWKSQYNSIFLHSNVFRIICLIALHSGNNLGEGETYWRLRSLQERLHRQLPMITPSGLSIGTTLNTQR